MGSANGCCRDPKVDNVKANPTGAANATRPSSATSAPSSSAAVKVSQAAIVDKTQEKAGDSVSAVVGTVNDSFQPDDPDPPPPLPASEPPIEETTTVVDVFEARSQVELDRDNEDEGIESVYDALDDGSSDQNEFENLDYNTFQTLEDVQEQEVEEDKMSGIGALQIQKPAPQFAGTAVVDGQFKDIQLSDYKGKYVIFFFYPLDFTFVCPTEIIAFSEAAEKFREIGCEVIAASTDSHFSHLAWVNTPRKQGGLGEMKIPLLADKTGEIAKKYGVYKEDEGIAFRGLFIIDDKQNLRQITINDLPVGRSVEETLRLVQAFQFTDVHGEVCPAGWKPGDKTIKPGVSESKAFFESS